MDEARLAELLRRLPPPPEGWVRAAQELPFARRTLDEIVARAEADVRFREALLADLEAALTDGYSSYGGMGLGLPGCRRLMDEFEISSEVDRGTTLVMTKWRT